MQWTCCTKGNKIAVKPQVNAAVIGDKEDIRFRYMWTLLWPDSYIRTTFI